MHQDSQSDVPFLGSLYNSSDGMFKGSCLTGQLLIRDIKITGTRLCITVNFGENINALMLQSGGGATHVVVGVDFELDKHAEQEHQPGNHRYTTEIRWSEAAPCNQQTLEVNLILPQRNTVISNYSVIRLQDFRPALCNEDSRPNLDPYSDRLDLLFPTYSLFYNEIQNFCNMLDQKLAQVIDPLLRNQFNVIAKDTMGVQEAVKSRILCLIESLAAGNWLYNINSSLDNVLESEKALLAQRTDFQRMCDECRSRAEFCKMLLDRGIELWNPKLSLDEAIKIPGVQYYVLFFGRSISSDKQNYDQNMKYMSELCDEAKAIGGKYRCRFLAVDVDGTLSGMQQMKMPKRVAIRLFQNGKLLCYDILADSKQTNRKSFVSFRRLNEDDVPPKKKGLLTLPCPGSFNRPCPDVTREWVCQKCHARLQYGFDERVYCGCGSAAFLDCQFRCADFKHGVEFISAPLDLYIGFLKNIKPMKEYNLLILGQSGIGKSTWINAIVNYMTYNDLQDAERGRIITTVPTKFTITDDNYKVVEICVGDDDNENKTTGASATQDCRTYFLNYGDTIINLIDTPGIGDTRGIEQDRLNVKRILDHIRFKNHLHGICILLKPNESRIGVLFRFCIKELLTHLHRSASQNILFCFTHARSTFYKPGDTLPVLEKLLSDINVTISLARDRIYCLDNEAFRFLCTLSRPHISYSADDRQTYTASWDKSVGETERMLNFVFTLPPHQVKDTMTLNNARAVILSLTKPLAEITANIQVNIAVMDAHKRMIRNWNKSEKELEKQLYLPSVVLEQEKLNHPRTVCTSQSCVEYYKLNTTTQIEYKTHCHPHCYLENIELEQFPNPGLINCAAMLGKMNCSVCSCRWERHMHINYSQKRTMRKVLDATVQMEIHSKVDARAKKEVILRHAEREMAKLDSEQKKIMKISVKFGQFLKNNAITPYNDAMKDYLRYLIEQEKSKCDATDVDRDVLLKLEKTKLEYEEEVRVLETAMSSKYNVMHEITPEDIQRWQQELYELPINGKQLKQTMELVMEAEEAAARHGHKNLNQVTKNTSNFNFGNSQQQNVPQRGRNYNRGRGRGFSNPNQQNNSWRQHNQNNQNNVSGQNQNRGRYRNRNQKQNAP